MTRLARYAIVDRTAGFRVVDIVDAANGKEALRRFMRNHAMMQHLYEIRKRDSAWFLQSGYGLVMSAEMVCAVYGALIDNVHTGGTQTIVYGAMGAHMYSCGEKQARSAYLQAYLESVWRDLPEASRPKVGEVYL